MLCGEGLDGKSLQHMEYLKPDRMPFPFDFEQFSCHPSQLILRRLLGLVV